MNCELPDVQAGFRKGRGARDQIANIRWIIEIAREFQKNIYFCLIDYARLDLRHGLGLIIVKQIIEAHGGTVDTPEVSTGYKTILSF